MKINFNYALFSIDGKIASRYLHGAARLQKGDKFGNTYLNNIHVQAGEKEIREIINLDYATIYGARAVQHECSQNAQSTYLLSLMRFFFLSFHVLRVSDGIACSRDLDAEITEEQLKLIQEFADSDKAFHVIRSQEPHFNFHPINAGLCAWKPAFLAKIRDTFLEHYQEWMTNPAIKAQHSYYGPTLYGIDELFLSKFVWPYAKKSVLVHQIHESKWDSLDQEIRIIPKSTIGNRVF